MHATSLIERYFAAWNRHDASAIASYFADGGIYIDVAFDYRSMPGELEEWLEDYFDEEKLYYSLASDVLHRNDTIAFKYRMVPRHPTSDRRGSFDGAVFIDMVDWKFVLLSDYYDPAAEGYATVPDSVRTKYAKSGLAIEQLEYFKEKLIQLMLDRKPYLTPNMTLPKMAEQMDCSVNHLSQVINAGFGSTFFGLMNRYRVEHAKELLSRSEDSADGIRDTAYQSGFNSHSAFYAAFKKDCGQTPAQFRRSMSNPPDEH
jgi:AraC-like DNA-binding protein